MPKNWKENILIHYFCKYHKCLFWFFVFQRRCLFLKIWLALTIILGNKHNIVTRIFQRNRWLLLLFFSHLQWQLISNFQTQIIFWWFGWFNTCPIYLFYKNMCISYSFVLLSFILFAIPNDSKFINNIVRFIMQTDW